MSEKSALSDEASDGTRLPKKHKWRGKLFSADGKLGRNVQNVESTEHDIANFLGPSARTDARLQSTIPSSRIDAVQDVRRPTIQSPQAEVVNYYRRPKPRQNKGLRVTFNEAAPEVIGEGGDEAAMPAREVSTSYLQSITHIKSTAQGALLGSVVDPPEAQHRPIETEVDGFSRPALLPRIHTGLEERPPLKNSRDEDLDADADESVGSNSLEKTPKASPQSPQKSDDLYGYKSKSQSEGVRQETFQKRNEVVNVGDRYADQLQPRVNHHVITPLDLPSPNKFTGRAVNRRPLLQASMSHVETSSSNHSVPIKGSISRSPPTSLESKHREQPEIPAASEATSMSFRSVAISFGEASLEDFSSRVERFSAIFRIGVSAQTDMINVPFVQWIRTANWWFLKGRAELESAVRAQASRVTQVTPDSPEDSAMNLKQAQVNLAKVWWIVTDITPTHPSVRMFGKLGMGSLIAILRNLGNLELAELVEIHMSIISNMRALSISMKRNGKMPPYELEIQSLELQILPDVSAVPPDVAQFLVNNNPGASADTGWFVAKPFFPTLAGDTGRHFSFCRLFVEASVSSHGGAVQYHQMPCVVTVLRERGCWSITATVASHDGQINLIIQPSGHGGLTWKDVHWKVPSQMINIDLAEDYELRLQFSDKDFRSLWGIFDYTRRVLKDYSFGKSEDIIFECKLDKFQCHDPSKFPSETISDCRLRLFEKKRIISDGPSQRSIHDGYRLTIVTPPEVRTLSYITYRLGKDTPILFSYQLSGERLRFILRISSSITLAPTFYETQDRETFRALLCGTLLTKDEYVYETQALRHFDIEELAVNVDLTTQPADASHRFLPCKKLRVINRSLPPYGHRPSLLLSADHPRLMLECDAGTLTDRVNLGPGELQMNLNIDEVNEIKLLRPPQSDMTCSMIDGKVPKEELDTICRTLQMMAKSMTVRRYQFCSLSDLHNFQYMMTGFKVLFDGPLSNFAISRRRKGLPLHKHWEATSARVQVLERNKSVQLVLFFKDFSHGACMNFVLKFTDVFEIYSKSGLFFLLVADAKFAMPKNDEDKTKNFVCLDMPEFPGEHDDITLGFDTEQGMPEINILTCELILP